VQLALLLLLLLLLLLQTAVIVSLRVVLEELQTKPVDCHLQPYTPQPLELSLLVSDPQAQTHHT
jgi:hypothetical protein